MTVPIEKLPEDILTDGVFQLLEKNEIIRFLSTDKTQRKSWRNQIESLTKPSGFLTEPDQITLFPALKKLNLNRMKIQNQQLVHLHLTGLNNWNHLDLHYTKVISAGLVHLAGLNNLNHLVLSGNNVTDAGLVHLAGLHNLNHLDLHDTNVTDAGLVHLAGLHNLKNFKFNKKSKADQT